MEAFKIIKRVVNRIAPGRTPSFNEAQIIKTFEIIQSNEYIGRIKLSEKLGLGEGVTRTIIKHIKNENLILISKNGICLSDFGKNIFYNIRSKISPTIEVPSSSITLGPFNVAILVKDAAYKIGKGVEQRDAAIKVEALGATTLIYSKKRLIMPSNNSKNYQETNSIFSNLIHDLNPTENDVIIIGSGKNLNTAELGAIMAALSTL